ncbi:hypothetical protein JCM3775_004031 [Rhodotorula graminis]
MSAPHSTLFLDRDLTDAASNPPAALSSSHYKPAAARGQGGATPAPSSPTSAPPDALMASPSASLAMLSMLPTPPASLPTAAAHFVDDAAVPRNDTAPFAGHELNTEPATPPRAERRGTTPPFALDDLVDLGDIDAGQDVAVAMDLEGSLDLDSSAPLRNLLDGPFAVAPFGTAAPIHRPFRSRYASSSTDSLDLDAPAADFADEPLNFDDAVSHKRSHADVLPSTGHTPPASFGDTLARPTSLFSPPEPAEERAVSPRWRRSFSYDAQRAEPTTSVVAATATAAAPSPSIAPSSSLGLLRRRARQPTESDSSLASSHWIAPSGSSAVDRAHSKRRRSGTLGASGGDSFGGAARSVTAGDDAAAARSRTQGRLGTFPFDAAMTSIVAEPALLVAVHGAPSSSTSAPHDPQQAYDALLTHAARSDALAARGEGLLREAAGVLARAEEEVGRAGALVRAREADRERERERQVAQRLPSTDGLHYLREVRERPVIGIRLGEGWTPSSPVPAPVSPTSPPLPVLGHRRSSSLWSLSSGFSSPPPQTADPHSPPLDGTSSSASNRARSFLTQLRARRPRLSRNSTAVSPPESSPASPPAVSSTSTIGTLPTASPSASSSTAALRTWTLPSPPLVGPFAESSYDESAELAAAERLNRRLLERRRVSESLDLGTALPAAPEQIHPAPETSLWGEPSGVANAGGIVRRLRGPTQVANERRRFGPSGGEPPFSMTAGPSTATTTATSTTSRLSTPPWRRLMRPTGVDRRESITGTQAGDAHYFDRVRDESPSLRRERYGSTAALNAAEEGTSPRRHSLEQHRHRHTVDLVRPTIRLPRPDSATDGSTSRPRLLFDDDDDDEHRQPASRAGGWAAPLTLPLMLPSGRDGMLFPHPAAAAGAADPGAALGMERQRSASPFGNFGPDHLFHDPPRDEPSSGARRTMPWHEAPASAYASRRTLARFDPWADLPTTNTTATNANAVPLASRIAPRRSSLTDTLSSLGARAAPPDVDTADTSLRRRRAQPQQARAGPSIGDDADAHFLERRRALDSFRYGDETVVERLAQHRASRMERLQALRRERHAMRTLLGGGGDDIGDGAASPSAERGPLDATNPWAPPEPMRERTGTPPQARARSPGGARGRGLGDFLRGLGGGGTRYAFGGRAGLIGIWDDDLAGFFTRDSAALDPRNYLDDDEFDNSYEALIRLSERLGDAKPKGVSADQLESLRKYKYADWPLPTRASSPPASASSSTPAPVPAPVASTSAHSLDPPTLARPGLDKETRCGICLCDYEDDDDCMLTVCEHGFHDECLRSWLTQKGTCPVCRRDHVSA